MKGRKEPTGDRSDSREGEEGAQGGGSGAELVAGWEMCRTKGSEHCSRPRGEGGQQSLSQTRFGRGGTTKGSTKKNRRRRHSSERERTNLVVTGHLLLILGGKEGIRLHLV